MWNAQTGRPITPAPGPMRHAIAVRDACFSPDGGRLVTAGFDGMARDLGCLHWRTTLSPVASRRGPPRARFTPDGSQVLTVMARALEREIAAITGVGCSPLSSGSNA